MMNPNHSGSTRRPFSRGTVPRSRSRIPFSPHPHHSQRNNNNHGQHSWYKDMDPCYSDRSHGWVEINFYYYIYLNFIDHLIFFFLSLFILLILNSIWLKNRNTFYNFNYRAILINFRLSFERRCDGFASPVPLWKIKKEIKWR